MSIETLNEISAEHYQYLFWENEQKNRILRMANEQRKQEEWKKIFPPPFYKNDDSWLEEAVVF